MPAPSTVSPLRVLALVIALDLALGLWVNWHYPEALPAFFLINTPTVGAAAFVWGLLPKTSQETIGKQVEAFLESRGTRNVLIGALIALAVASVFFGGFRVTLLETDTTTMMRVVRGTQSDPDSAAMAGADSFRLDRLSTPHHSLALIPPWGARVWLHSPTHVSFRDARLVPWRPARLTYPSDFVPLSQIAVVVHPDVLGHLMQDSLSLVLSPGETAEELARVPLGRQAILVAFLEPRPPSGEDITRWHGWLDSMSTEPDTSARQIRFHADMERFWRAHTWARARRPLRQGETLNWVVRTAADSIRAHGRLTLDAPTTDFHLHF